MSKQPELRTWGAENIFDFLCSLKLTVVVISTLALALAAGTILESLYDTRTSQYFVYGSMWFHFILASLAVNLFSVMVDRWPWKLRHAPFLLAHIGILILLMGSWLTEHYGLDGNIRVSEGESVKSVELDRHSIVLSQGGPEVRVPIPWTPPQVEFSPISLKDRGIPFDLTIDRYLSHADSEFSFIPDLSEAASRPHNAAAKLRIEGGPMRSSQEFWLWMGDAIRKTVQMGPARFEIGSTFSSPMSGQPSFSIVPEKVGFSYRAVSSEGKTVRGHIENLSPKMQVIDPGWKGGLKLTILDWQPSALPITYYRAARVQFGPGAPGSAVHVLVGKGGPGAETWLARGDHVMVRTAQGVVEIGYLPERVVLPFAVTLKQFKVERYEGSQKPSSFSSQVRVNGGPASTISMNEPLAVQGITLYQASYEDAKPRPTVSIFSVNQDPGRIWKYLGSLLIVLGSILLFAVKYRKSKQAAQISSQVTGSTRVLAPSSGGL